jgi:hypothetical protein
MIMLALLLYGVPLAVVLVTVWTGWLGFRFYLDEVVRAPRPVAEERA